MGHLFGDAVLSDLSASIQGETRSSDLVGRIGGDEFLVFLKKMCIRDRSEPRPQNLQAVVPFAWVSGASSLSRDRPVSYTHLQVGAALFAFWATPLSAAK